MSVGCSWSVENAGIEGNRDTAVGNGAGSPVNRGIADDKILITAIMVNYDLPAGGTQTIGGAGDGTENSEVAAAGTDIDITALSTAISVDPLSANHATAAGTNNGDVAAFGGAGAIDPTLDGNITDRIKGDVSPFATGTTSVNIAGGNAGTSVDKDFPAGGSTGVEIAGDNRAIATGGTKVAASRGDVSEGNITDGIKNDITTIGDNILGVNGAGAGVVKTG